MPRKRQPLPPDHPLSLPLPSQFPVPPAPYGEHGYVASLDHSGTCRACGLEGGIERRPGTFPRCFHCGVIQLYMGKFYDAHCVTPNGRTDGHMSYAVVDGTDVGVCAFCGRQDDEPLPEWPEIEEEDIQVEVGHGIVGKGMGGHIQGQNWVRITHRYHPEISVLADSHPSLLKNKALALKGVREALKRVGRGAYNPEE